MRSILFAKISFMVIISIVLGSTVEACDEYGDIDLGQKPPTFVVLVQSIGDSASKEISALKYSLEFEGSIVKELGTYSLNYLFTNPKPFDLDSFSSPFLEDTDPQLIKKMNSVIDSIKKEKVLYDIIYR